jgi:hypothetical protein
MKKVLCALGVIIVLSPSPGLFISEVICLTIIQKDNIMLLVRHGAKSVENG